MNILRYISGLRAEAADTQNQINLMVKHGTRMEIRWGREPMRDFTKQRLSELRDHVALLNRLANSIERGCAI